ncbi:MAG: hypothetical protein RLQ25_11995 [Alphaproteobacteria bacterium]
MPLYEQITSGPGTGLGYIRAKYGQRQVRIVGFMNPADDVFTAVLPVIKKSRTLSRQDWETAQRRRRSIQNGSNQTGDWEF